MMGEVAVTEMQCSGAVSIFDASPELYGFFAAPAPTTFVKVNTSKFLFIVPSIFIHLPVSCIGQLSVR